MVLLPLAFVNKRTKSKCKINMYLAYFASFIDSRTRPENQLWCVIPSVLSHYIVRVLGSRHSNIKTIILNRLFFSVQKSHNTLQTYRLLLECYATVCMLSF